MRPCKYLHHEIIITRTYVDESFKVMLIYGSENKG